MHNQVLVLLSGLKGPLVKTNQDGSGGESKKATVVCSVRSAYTLQSPQLNNSNCPSPAHPARILPQPYRTPPSELSAETTRIKERVRKDSAVREVMRLDNPFSKPVWMVVGIKIARGFKLNSGGQKSDAGNLGAGGGAGGPVSGGGDVGVELNSKKDLRFESGTDIVFAYQLLRIVAKGWKEKGLMVEEHFAGADFLSDEGLEEKDVEVEEELAEVEDLREIGSEFAQYTKTASEEGEYVCVVANVDPNDEDSEEDSDED